MLRPSGKAASEPWSSAGCPALRPPRGGALLLVLWAILVLSTAILVVARLVDFDMASETIAAQRFAARQMALTGLAHAKHPQIERGDPLLFQTFENTRGFEVLVESENARLNINTLLLQGGERTLERLFRHWGLEEREALIAVDSLKDWVDGDDLRSLHGAEYHDIPEGSGWSRPENRPFFSVAEMERVRGMEYVRRANPDWMRYFSVHSSNRLDLQDVSEDLLEVVGGLTSEQARAIITYRNGADGLPGTPEDNRIESVETLQGIVALSPAQMEMLQANFGAGGGLLRILSRGRAGGAYYEISALIQRRQDQAGQVEILEWSEQ